MNSESSHPTKNDQFHDHSHDHFEPEQAAYERRGHRRGHGFPGRGGFGPGGHGFGPGGFGPGGFGPAGFNGFGPRGFGPGGGRKRRGDIRIAILSLISDKPYNGYALIKEITERSGNTWRPSPGSVYPTLQQLVDEELIEPIGKGKRTEFQLTEAGGTYVTEHAEELKRVWQESSEQAEQDTELRESVMKLMGVIQQFRFGATQEQRTKAAGHLDDARRALYGILAD